MAELTENYGLQRLRPGESFSLNDGKFLDEDRVTIDRLLRAARLHEHTGGSLTNVDPLVPLNLSVSTTGGTLPGGTRIFYKYALVDAEGAESAASPEAFVDTGDDVVEPGAASLASAATGGTLLAGTYYYALSAYKGANTLETLAGESSSIILASGSTNAITLTLPSTPTGATGFNVYRRKPGASQYFYLTSVSAGPATWVDTGAAAEDCDRTLPFTNTTASTNSVTITLPGATPTVPVGYTWRLYRTMIASDYDTSLLHHVVEETTEGSGVITPTYFDAGLGTSPGSPKTASQMQSPFTKVDLQNGVNVEGKLPMSQVSGYPFAETFSFEGDTIVMSGTSVWTCPFPQARIVSVRASLGRTYAPASTDVIVDVNKGSGLTPSYATIFTTQTNRPKVLVGNQVGTPTVPDTIELVAGDSLSVDIDQTGGGATPTDRDLTVTVYMIVYGYTDPLSLVW